ncbi:plastid division protein CDP1, chloroplastic [Humulus lupulus]|uniref:plastid division protein CDP1, chloroplastic n=1 Tax=Humulus lupulus TaxID=3486 RepID=UPI002B40C1CF|nr:plastid division protein CDP1, chloroplastic [Humulus lupulus]
MALAQALPRIPSTCWLCRINKTRTKTKTSNTSNTADCFYYYSSSIHKEDQKKASSSSGIAISRVYVWRKGNCGSPSVNGRWRLSAVDTRIVQNVAAPRTTVEIPVTCYQLIGVTDQAEKDEIVKSVMNLKNAEIEEGYSMDVVSCRQDLLMDVRDKLLFEPEYAGDTREKIPPKSSLRVPWTWLPGALCLLQEVGEVKLVLDIGRVALQHPDAKPFIHDLLLSMALAECANAKIGFEKNKVSQGFEALARAQSLLRSKKFFDELMLLSQIEESLEELAPACTLELLGMPNSPENAERRQGAMKALRELLRQGLDLEASCQVQDWSCFFSQALNKLMAAEIVDLHAWDDLATTRKNKKSLESQNQRVVVDFNCFYVVLVAHIAVGFSSKQREMISKAKTICECLKASEGIDLKLEEAFCLFLLGQGTKDEVVEKLKQLVLNSNSSPHKSISGRDIKDASDGNQLLETWLKDTVLHVFPDTRDCSPTLVNYFNGERRTLGSKRNIGGLRTNSSVGHRPMQNTLLSERKNFEDSISRVNSSQHLGTAVKQLTPIDLQSSLISDKSNIGSSGNASSVQLKRNLSMHHSKVWDSWFSQAYLVRRFTSVAVLGCIFFATLKLTSMNVNEMRNTSKYVPSKSNSNGSSHIWKADSSIDNNVVPAYIKGDGFPGRLKHFLATVATLLKKNSDSGNSHTSLPATSLSSSMRTMSRSRMPMEEAEELVKQWQAIKAEALGPSHQVHSLSEILDESMLVQWHALADAAQAKSCYWKFVLLQLSVLRAEILSDGIEEVAEIEALLEEAAELVNESELKNPSYYSNYKIRYVLRRQDDDSWKFCEGDIQKS